MGNGASLPGIDSDDIQAAIADLERVQKLISYAETKEICGVSTNLPYASVEGAKKARKTQSEIDAWSTANQYTGSASAVTMGPPITTNNEIPSSAQRTECVSMYHGLNYTGTVYTTCIRI